MSNPTIEDVVRAMLDGRENDEQITVEVSLLWSLVQRIETNHIANQNTFEYVFAVHRPTGNNIDDWPDWNTAMADIFENWINVDDVILGGVPKKPGKPYLWVYLQEEQKEE